MKTIRYISYHEFGDMMRRLIGEVWDFQPTHIYSPPRGGLPIGVHLSHHLGNIPFLSGTGFPNFPLSLKEALSMRVLFADDIVDHGRTLERFVEQTIPYHNYWGLCFMSCSLLVKPGARIKPDLWIETVPDSEWIVFPWEDPVAAEKEEKEYQNY